MLSNKYKNSIITQMSGHSKWSTIKRKKQAEDIARGKLFSKLSKAISVAVKSGGSDDPEINPKLRVAIDQAKAANMPKDNIERAISKGSGAGEDLSEVVYEGYGPGGVAIIVETATDNRNRTAQEIKSFFERGGGSLAGPGAVSYNFERKGLILVKKMKDVEEQMLDIIDTGVEDVEETQDGIEAYVEADETSKHASVLKEKGHEIKEIDLVQRPKVVKRIDDARKAEKMLKFLDNLENHDDVQKVFANFDIPETTLDNIQNS